MLNKKEKEVINILKNDGIGVLPTDTIYGLVCSSFSKKAINRIYKIKNRDKKKKFINLISSINDLKKFNIKISKDQAKILRKFWPGKVSIILSGISFRFPKNKKLIEILEKTGPLVVPSANPEGLEPAENIVQAKEYFGNNIDFYLSGRTLNGKPSVLIKMNENSQIEILRGILKTNGK